MKKMKFFLHTILTLLDAAVEGIHSNIAVQEEFSGLSEHYYVLCKKAYALKMKNIFEP